LWPKIYFSFLTQGGAGDESDALLEEDGLQLALGQGKVGREQDVRSGIKKFQMFVTDSGSFV